MPPFQLMRESRGSESALTETNVWEDSYLGFDGQIVEDTIYDSFVTEYGVAGLDAVLFKNYNPNAAAMDALIAAYDSNGVFLEAVAGSDIPAGDYSYTLPEGAATVRVMGFYNAEGVYDSVVGYITTTPITSIEIFDAKTNTSVTGNAIAQFNDAGLTIKAFPQFGYDVIVFPGLVPVFANFLNGQYYAQMSDGTETWYSEIFTVVNDIEPYLKIEWADIEDFVMDAGTIVYKNPTFRNVLYLNADIAKPEYIFEDEGETRDGYFFPTKQISEKRYRFNFFASEYLLDVMRFIRMADYAQITYRGQIYSLDTFLISPEWEDNGDVAVVEAEFETATVAKKIGKAYVKAQRGDFNDDFNNDFFN